MGDELSFGSWLQRRRRGLDLTQAELARRIGYARVTIHKIETDQLRASHQMADKLADALAIDPAEREAFVRFARDDTRAGPSQLPPPFPERAPVPGPSRRRHNLPVPPNRLIGREWERQDGCALLRGDVRLLTLTGAGGIGKTRLAIEIAAALVDTFPDGVWLVELASVDDSDHVPAAVAAVLGLRDVPGQALQASLVAALRSRRLLLVLDNCEHLVDACARLGEEIVRAAPDVRILATSREALRIAAEVVRPVPPLALPPRGIVPAVDEVERYEAARLFVERARAARPAFEVGDEHTAAALAHICHRLDGIPLALELAAARAGALGVRQLAARLDDRFDLLTGGSRTALPRQRTLRATIDWSHGLLSVTEQTLLRRLSVFAGGWTLEAAETVCPGREIDGAELLDGLAALVAKSLVVVEERGGDMRYRLLETLRQYAWELLLASGEATETRRRHLAWCVGLAERSDPVLPGTHHDPGLEHLETEHDNLRAALAWSLESDPDTGMRLAGRLAEFWRRGGHHAEGRRWLRAVLAATDSPGAPRGARAQVLLGAGSLAADAGEVGPDQVSQAEESVRLFRDAGDRRGLVAALQHLGRCALASGGDANRVRPVFDESMRLARTLGDQHAIGFALANLGYLAWCQGDRREARALYEAAIAHVRRSGDAMFTGLLLGALGWYTMVDGDLERARRYKEEGLAILRRLEAAEAVGLALLGLAHLARREGDGARLRTLLEESAPLLQETGSPGLADWLSFVGQVQVGRGAYTQGVRLLAAGESDGPRAGSLRTLSYTMPRDERDACLAAARAALGVEAFAAAWAEGAAMSEDRAIADSLADAPSAPARPEGMEKAPSSRSS